MKKYRYVKRKTVAVPIQIGKFEDKYMYGPSDDFMVECYQAVQSYVDKPDKNNKEHLAKLLKNNWHEIPKEVTKAGKGFRLWVFNKENTKQILEKLLKTKAFSINQSSFLSYTSKVPKSESGFKKLWSVIRSANPKEGDLLLTQKQDYKKGFSITDFYKYLLDNGYLVEEDEVESEDNYEDLLDEEVLRLINEEQEILVFDGALNIKDKDLIDIKVTVDNKDPDKGISIRGYKFVDVDSIDEAYHKIKSMGID